MLSARRISGGTRCVEFFGGMPTLRSTPSLIGRGSHPEGFAERRTSNAPRRESEQGDLISAVPDVPFACLGL